MCRTGLIITKINDILAYVIALRLARKNALLKQELNRLKK